MRVQKILIKGRVQGVGFRPTLFRLAQELKLLGEIANISGSVVAHLQGKASALTDCLDKIQKHPPPQSRIDSVEVIQTENIDSARYQTLSIVMPTVSEFKIETPSHADPSSVSENYPDDTKICKACEREFHDSTSRRYHYPLISCSECGPRASIIRALPYERSYTSMDAFQQCENCLNEYHDPSHRRFHAQNNCCPACGPEYSFWGLVDERAEKKHFKQTLVREPFKAAAKAISEGKILALKGISGYHLLCDARNEAVVARLRHYKQRPHKPFAVLAEKIEDLAQQVIIHEQSKKLLESPENPLVLLELLTPTRDSWQHICPGLDKLACYLPPSGAHLRLFSELRSIAPGGAYIRYLVSTSANLAGEPILADNDLAFGKLAGMADCMLSHNRDILQANDDSIVEGDDGVIIRRARGFSASAIRSGFLRNQEQLPQANVLALGASLKSSITLKHRNQTFVSRYLGDLESAPNCRNFEHEVEQTLARHQCKPELIACDQHPDFYSTKTAEALAQRYSVPLIKVQHHRAHAAATIAEFQIGTPAISLVLDGFGLGDAGALWGGEMFFGTLESLQHIGQFSRLPLIGGDKAVREIWRIGSALLHTAPSALNELSAGHRLLNAHSQELPIETLLKLSPVTSSAGRAFDAAASLLDVLQDSSYEGHAAMLLEALARPHFRNWLGTGLPSNRTPATRPDRLSANYRDLGADEGIVTITADNRLDLVPLLMKLIHFQDRSAGAWYFHLQLLKGLREWILKNCQHYQTDTVICAGGCFQNHILRSGLRHITSNDALNLVFSQSVPMNDGGISFGQACIAAQSARLSQDSVTQENKTCV